MPHEDETYFLIPLSDEDRLHIRFKTLSRQGLASELVVFAVILESKLDGGWHKIAKYDCDKSKRKKPHRHMLHWRGDQGKVTLGDFEDASRIFNEAKKKIRRDFKKIKEEYIMTKR